MSDLTREVAYPRCLSEEQMQALDGLGETAAEGDMAAAGVRAGEEAGAGGAKRFCWDPSGIA